MWYFDQKEMRKNLRSQSGRARVLIALSFATALALVCFADLSTYSHLIAQDSAPVLRGQSQQEADRKSAGCITCHTATDEPTMHPSKAVHIGCADCHGGNFTISVALGTSPASLEYIAAKEKAHIQPQNAFFKNRTSVPQRAFTEWLKESAENLVSASSSVWLMAGDAATRNAIVSTHATRRPQNLVIAPGSRALQETSAAAPGPVGCEMEAAHAAASDFCVTRRMSGFYEPCPPHFLVTLL